MSKKKIYSFEFEVTGRCFTTVEASSDEEAVKKLKEEDTGCELLEWDVDWPQNFDDLGVEDMMKYCSSKDDV